MAKHSHVEKPLTIEQSAGVSALVQNLIHKAETGEYASDHAISVRMLGSPFETPTTSFSFVPSLMAAEAPAAKTDSDDKFTQLTALLLGDTTPPAQQVGNGTIPKAPVVTIYPNYSNQDVQSNYATLVDASSMCQLYTNLLQVQTRPQGYDIRDPAQATLAFADQARFAYQAMTGPLAGFYNFREGAVRQFSNTINVSDIHDNFLGKVFEPYQFDAATTQSLDGILTTFVDALKTVNADNSPTGTQNFCLRLNLCPRRNISGSDSDPVYIYQPTTFLIYMKIASRTYSQSVSKNTSVNKVDFTFELTTTKCELNVRQFEANRTRFNAIFKLVTEKNLDEYSNLLNKKITSQQENPGATA